MGSTRLAKHYAVEDVENEPVRVVEVDVVVMEGVVVRRVPQDHHRTAPFEDLTSVWHKTPGEAVDTWRKDKRADHQKHLEVAAAIEKKLTVENGRIEVVRS